jgi:biotin-[acetyl-CoA-carboxylase] ligase BirA-like protein
MTTTLKSISETTSAWAGQRQLECQYFPETESTNDLAKTNALRENSKLMLYLTDHQTKGRGRSTNQWLDTGAGESLLMTVSVALPSAPQAIAGPRMGLALFSAVHDCWPSLKISLKAPNDLLLDGKKTAGLLLESISKSVSHRMIVGIGLNVLNHPRKFNEATHIRAENGEPLNPGEWFQFLDLLMDQIHSAADDCTKPQLSDTSCKQLLNALNANPLQKIKFNRVTPSGDLVHSGGTISWMDL